MYDVGSFRLSFQILAFLFSTEENEHGANLHEGGGLGGCCTDYSEWCQWPEHREGKGRWKE